MLILMKFHVNRQYIWFLLPYLKNEQPARIFLREIKRIPHEDFSVCSLNTQSFYHGLIHFVRTQTYVCISGGKIVSLSKKNLVRTK